MKKITIFTGLLLLFLSCFMAGCFEEVDINAENILQINDVGLREGVFIRRYKITNEFGNHQVFTPELLKSYIKEKMESDYLFIANARELGFQNDNSFKQIFTDYRINLIAGVHPLHFQIPTISEKALMDLYQKKSYMYDVDLVLANSYTMADSMYKFLLAGKKIADSGKKETKTFPQYFHLKSMFFGEQLHPELLPILSGMEEGQVCKPVFTSPIWSILRLNSKRKNTGLQSYEKMAGDLNKQLQVLISFENKKQLIKDLKEKYPLSINENDYPKMISAFTYSNNQGWIDKNKMKASDLEDTFLTINNEEISLSSFIASFNKGVQFMNLQVLTKKDLEMLANDYVTQNLLYLDALQKGADQDVLIKDKLANKENKLLLTKYLQEEIGHKVVISDAEARQYYDNNRDKWPAAYKEVEKSVKFDLRNIRLYERRSELTDKLRKKYKVRYNESLLQKVSIQLTEEKGAKREDITIQ